MNSNANDLNNSIDDLDKLSTEHFII